MGFFQGSKYSYCTTLAADIIAFIAGTSIGWSSPAIAILESDITRIPLNKRITEEASWIVSLLPLGGVFGPFIFGFFIQTIGRKITVIMIAFPFLIAYLIAAFAKTVWQLYVARILMGIGLGGVFGVVPIFIVEIVEDVNRGLLLASPICFSTLGLLFSYILGSYVSIMIFNLILAILCIIYIPIFWFVAPETPYYLIRVNKEEKALESLYYLRRKSRDDLLTELKAIKSHLSEKITQGSLLEIFKTKAFFYSVVLTTLQQYSGATIILYFAENIFENAGNNIAPEISSIIIALVQFVVSFISLPLIDKCGRRILLLVSVSGACLSEAILGVYFYLKDNGYDILYFNWLPLVSLVAFLMFHNFGMASMPLIILGEILSPNVISKASTMITSFNYLIIFFLVQYFPFSIDMIGMAGTFWLFASFCVIFALFVYFFIFETKGKSLKEIQTILNK